MNNIFSKWLYIWGFVSLCGVATALSAAPTLQYSKTYDECTHAAKSSTNKQKCISAEYQRQNQRLKNAEQKLSATLSATEQKRLLDAQKEWRSLHTFYDDQCNQTAFDAENAPATSSKKITELDCDQQFLERVTERANELEQGKVRAEYYLDP
ncbi:lysozyme inhibitor LprI family protein [Acinetobacter sp.]|uniref:lysozyme inhibitor LprI family protein n=1 Tax=Acinetobacter sp. TaxID=472 RepID=UPI0033413018